MDNHYLPVMDAEYKKTQSKYCLRQLPPNTSKLNTSQKEPLQWPVHMVFDDREASISHVTNDPCQQPLASKITYLH